MSDPADDIMRATYDALCRHGYADLTMRHIAEAADCSKASLHYHYESKQGLMLAFLDYLFERFTERVGGVDGEGGVAGERADGSADAAADPDARLREFVDDVLHPPAEGDTAREFRTALLEIKAQSPYDDAFGERIAAFDDHIYGTVHDLVVAGIDAGVYREGTDPDEVARFVLALVDGAQARHVVAGEDVDALQTALETYLDALVQPTVEPTPEVSQ
ncbi:transcriptional regulator, TetR family [Halomicrobium zhouii]|uniref:Transcriptional regulator, TetR family n=1 Tax=Halomicrobium zhouii TaxID=767519 RepID=A0A1I6K1F2_9EURY|nr:TetR/AcrR family transcriptional regulator [Halomicrobium zhouii]SFR84928.1 transcriptional regulator, TetR family [Halomicrobium zhouii]